MPNKLRSHRSIKASIPSFRAIPSDFLWGASTAAYQIEGAPEADGRGPCIWDRYFKEKGHPGFGKDNGDVACAHYQRWREDIELLKQLGLDSYRLSTSWSRIRPTGRGPGVNWRGLDFYSRLVDALLEAGITPFITLYHWDMPLALQHAEMGTRGWLDRDVGDHFADYAALMVKHLGDRINFWATVNEPEVIVAGYICDGLAPAYCQPSLGYQAGHNLLLAHGKALQAMRAATANRANQFGIVLNFNEIAPHRQTDMCRAAATRRWETAYAWYLDGLLRAFYPQSVLDRCAANGWDLNVQAGDMAIIAQALDWLGINWYTRFVVNEQGNDVSSDDVPRTLMGWEIDAPAFARTLIKLNGEYRLPPVYITENGAALKDRSRRGIVHDDHRIDYLHQHIRALEQAIVAGVDVRGYSVWSLLDNLEWSLGFSRTFGIVHVNRTNLNRTIKDSGIWYANVIAKHKHRA